MEPFFQKKTTDTMVATRRQAEDNTQATPQAGDSQSMPSTQEMISMPANTFAIPAISMANARWKTGGGSQRLMAILRSPGNTSALRQLMTATNAMIALPLGTMALCHYFLLDQLFTFRNANEKVVYSGIAAICMVQVVVIWFVVSAFREEPEAAPATARPHAD